MAYRAPINEILFLLDHVVGFDEVLEAQGGADKLDRDTFSAILTEAGSVCENVLAPLQRAGDLYPARLENGSVRCSPGYHEGYRAIAEGGWIGLNASSDYGGMGLPRTLGSALHDMMSGACLSLQLNPLLTQGQIHALEVHGSRALKNLYLPKLISGDWAGTMNLTEPQAGSDVGALRTKAERNEDGSYAVTGQKIYISWGDSDITENICHMVLARLEGAPEGTNGISLFLIPKFIPNEDGSLGPRNDLRVVSLEHKLGMHGSPTAVMEYTGAKGWLVGEEHGGLAAMFTMMNDARLNVGVEGVGVAEAAYQQALDYAANRVQGRTAGPTGTILDHSDVRRMLVTMRVRTQAARAVAFSCATALDMAVLTGDPAWQARGAFLTPIAKAFGTETGMAVSDMGIQVHGGMGVIEETGAAQFARDVRVTAIYEGTNGIQAMDLVSRKLRDDGDAAFALLDEIEAMAEDARSSNPKSARILWDASENLRDTTEWMLSQDDPEMRFAGSVPYLHAFALLLGGYYHLKSALADGPDPGRMALATAYLNRVLPGHLSLTAEAMAGSGDLHAVSNTTLGL